MAYASTDAAAPATGTATGFFEKLFRPFILLAESNSRLRRMQALNAMSDAELARRGIRREDIARHVFADVLYV
ncbi:hypothetical protein [Roseivivax isoporae]|uniref:DUF1127 domain-containing protein n=1 Tax=Roseivivax isoporae LMG 25204 TaxID=1449351 RepID=X7FCU7_9RHOB|nr:hypothetical protein [Roseivivax isoporae]ETX30538.1 hypothetical protein RISW2_12790 [Roseivivax isoporae LMG 25204]